MHCKMEKKQVQLKRYKLQNIDTKIDEANFRKLFGSKRTFFLNGAWGSGKSTFIEKVAGEMYAVKKLNLWNQDSKYSIFSLAFKVVHPVFYFFERFFIAVLFTASVIGLQFSQWGFNGNVSGILVFIIIFCTVLVAVGKLMEVKTNYFDKRFLKFHFYWSKTPVLVIDDFDRLTNDQQEATYKLLNFLHGDMEIVVLGDYRSLTLNKNTFFLHKIIDKRVELPFALQSNNIWTEYFNRLGNQLNAQIPGALIQQFIDDGRKLRDREQFNNLIIQEFQDNKKLKYVQVGQQLVLMYLYLYAYETYEKLMSKPDEYRQTNDKSLQELVNLLFHDETVSYPVAFMANRSNYLIFEVPKSLSIDEIEKIIHDPEKLKASILKNEDNDFYDYIVFRYYILSPEIRMNILKTAVSLVKTKRYQNVRTIKKIIQLEGQQTSQSNFNGRNVREWRKLLASLGYSITEQIWFLVNYGIQSYGLLGKNYFQEFMPTQSFSQNWESIKREKFPEQFLLVYLYHTHLLTRFDMWYEEVWNAVSDLNKDGFKVFCYNLNIAEDLDSNNFTLIKNFLKSNGNQNNKVFLTKMKSKIDEYGIVVKD